jgi:hypothetical protein
VRVVGRDAAVRVDAQHLAGEVAGVLGAAPGEVAARAVGRRVAGAEVEHPVGAEHHPPAGVLGPLRDADEHRLDRSAVGVEAHDAVVGRAGQVGVQQPVGSLDQPEQAVGVAGVDREGAPHDLPVPDQLEDAAAVALGQEPPALAWSARRPTGPRAGR